MKVGGTDKGLPNNSRAHDFSILHDELPVSLVLEKQLRQPRKSVTLTDKIDSEAAIQWSRNCHQHRNHQILFHENLRPYPRA